MSRLLLAAPTVWFAVARALRLGAASPHLFTAAALLWLAGAQLAAAEPRVPVTALAFAPDGGSLLANAQRAVLVFSLAENKLERTLGCDFSKLTGLAFSPATNILAVAGGTPGVGGSLRILAWPSGQKLHEFPHHSDLATGVAFNMTGTLLASTGADAVVHVLRGPDWETAFQLEGHSGPVLDAVFGPGDNLLVTASADRSIKVWDASTGRLQRSFSHHTDIVHGLTVRPQTFFDGQPVPFYYASGSDDHTVRVWQPAIGRMVRIVRGHGAPVFATAYHPDGTRLYSAGKEGIIRVIDGDSDEILHEWKAHGDWTYALAISPDGAVLASGDWQGTVKLWDVREKLGKPLGLLR